jgi:ERCC4-type nuclease
MKVIIDERETSLYAKCLELNTFATIQISKQVLPIGDILFMSDDDTKTLCIIERKSLADLLASIKDGRYEEQSYRLSNNGECSLHNVIYIIEGIMSTLRTPMEKRIVFSSITSLNYFKGFSVLRSSSVTETAELLLFAADKIARGLAEGLVTSASGEQNYCTVVKKVKKENVTPQNISEIMLCQIPGISSTNAIAVMKHFSSLSDLIDKMKLDPNCLDEIRIENNGKSRKIGKNCIDGIRNYLLPAALE